MVDSIARRLFLKLVGSAGAAAATIGLGNVAAAPRPGAMHADRLGWRLGCAAYSFRHLTFYETIDKVASLGLRQLVGFNWQKLSPQKSEACMSETMSESERRETKARLGDAGVQLAACYCRRLDNKDACRRLFDFAKDLGIETLDGEPPVAAVDMLEPLCDEYQINVAVHNHAKPSFYWEPETLLKLFAGRSKRIGACCDTGHWARSGLDPVATLAKLQGRILTFDLKDVNEKGICVPFGTGKGSIRAILQELHRQGFRGVFGIEYDQTPAYIEADIAQCAAYFDDVARQLVAA